MGDTTTPCGACESLRESYQAAHAAAQSHPEAERAFMLHGIAHEALLALEAPGEYIPARSPRELERLVFVVSVMEAPDRPELAETWRRVHEWLVRYQGCGSRATTEPRRALVDTSAVG